MVFNPQTGYSTKPDIAGQLNALSAILANISAGRKQAFQERRRREIDAEREATRKKEVAEQLALDTKLINASVKREKAERDLAEFRLEQAMETEAEEDVTAGLTGEFFAGKPGAPTLATPTAGAERLLQGVGGEAGVFGSIQQLLQNIGPAVQAAGVTRGPAQRLPFAEFSQEQIAAGVAPEAIGRLGIALGPEFTTPQTTTQMFNEAAALAEGGVPLPDRLSKFQPMWDRTQEINRIGVADSVKDSMIKDLQIELLTKEIAEFGKPKGSGRITSPATAYIEALSVIQAAENGGYAPPQWALDIVGGKLNPEGNTDFKVGLIGQLDRAGELGDDVLASESANIITGLTQGFANGTVSKDEILELANWAGIATLNRPINEILVDLEAKLIELGKPLTRESAKVLPRKKGPTPEQQSKLREELGTI